MLRDVLHSIRGLEHFGMISMLLFVAFFVLVLIYAYSIRKKDIDDYRKIPFDDSTPDQKIN
jgi:cbb3-type cytochrome oxidase subunit 3